MHTPRPGRLERLSPLAPLRARSCSRRASSPNSPSRPYRRPPPETHHQNSHPPLRQVWFWLASLRCPRVSQLPCFRQRITWARPVTPPPPPPPDVGGALARQQPGAEPPSLPPPSSKRGEGGLPSLPMPRAGVTRSSRCSSASADSG
jgi:hypothetical protein